MREGEEVTGVGVAVAEDATRLGPATTRHRSSWFLISLFDLKQFPWNFLSPFATAPRALKRFCGPACSRGQLSTVTDHHGFAASSAVFISSEHGH